jgi:hypothetical protein
MGHFRRADEAMRPGGLLTGEESSGEEDLW